MTALAMPTSVQLQGTVLVVDDDVGLQDTLCDILATTGITASGVGSSKEATRWCDIQQPDLVILDQRLPDASGVQLAGLLKARYPLMPVVLLTGYATAESAIAAVGLVDDYLKKPFPPAELIKVVRVRLEQYRLQLANTDLLKQLQHANARLEATVEERTRQLSDARDRAMEASLLKSQFLATMSHEIRTPMNGVIGVGHLLAATPLNGEQRQLVEILHSSGQALLRVINDVLDFSKIEAGRIELDASNVVLEEVFADVARLLAPGAFAKGLTLVLDCDPRLPRIVIGDGPRLGQVVTNLVGNAIKFTDEGDVVVTVEVTARSATSVTIRCEVRDTGIGIAEKDIPKLFADFSQVDTSHSRRHGGTGLGLAISQRLIWLMDGDIGCVRNDTGGSTFWFTASFTRAPTTAAADDDRSFNVAAASRRVAADTALVVSQHAATRDAVLRMLSSQGLAAVGAADAAEAWAVVDSAIASGRRVDIVVLDGITLDQFGPASNGSGIGLPVGRPVIALVSPQNTIAAAVTVEDRSPILTKPVTPSMLHAAVRKALSEENSASANEGGSKESTVPTPGPLILIVEDNEVNALILARMLTLLGYRSELATNGPEGLEAVARTSYAAVLMDCQMPIMDGFSTTRQIRAGNGSGATVPIIAVTGTATTDDEARCREAGMNDYLAKPIMLDRLADILGRWAPLS